MTRPAAGALDARVELRLGTLASRRRAARGRQRARRARRAQRRGQDLAAARGRRACSRSTPGASGSTASCSTTPPPACSCRPEDRPVVADVPGRPAVPPPRRARQRRVRAARARNAQGRRQRAGARAAWRGWVSKPSSTPSRTSSPAARPSASRSPARWPSSRGRCCSTSPSPRSMPEPASRCAASSAISSQPSTACGVLVTHDPLEALTLADRIVVIDGGRVVQVGSPDEVRRHPRSPYVAALLGVNLLAGPARGRRPVRARRRRRAPGRILRDRARDRRGRAQRGDRSSPPSPTAACATAGKRS